MKVMQINLCGNLSTGRIAVEIYRTLRDSGHEGLFAFSRNHTEPDVPSFQFGSKGSVYLDGILTRLTDRAGFYSKGPTRALIRKIREYDPDIIHLHNLHGYYLNIGMLFRYLQESGKPVVWTLHDCWAVTGHCISFAVVGCEKWKTGCHNCEWSKSYPKSYVDASRKNYEEKKRLFTGVEKLHLAAVSRWVESIVKESFLSEKPIETIYNGIDLDVFKPSPSGFRAKYGLEEKKIILGVSNTWTRPKGLNDFIALSKKLPEEYRIVLVGLTQEQKKDLPENILAFEKTSSVQELAEIYTAADVFFNASILESFGLPTVEAMACGTPAIVFDSTALPEVCTPESGVVVKPHDIDAVFGAVRELEKHPLKTEDIIARAREYDRKKQFQKYIDLYERILGEN